MPLIKINNDVEISYYLESHGNEIVTFLNGSIFNYKQWLPAYVPALRKLSKKKYSILLYDYQGIGQSTPKTDSFSLKGLANELNDLLNALNIEKTHVFGVSKGSMVAQVFTALYPEKVLSVGAYGVVNLLVKERNITREIFSTRLNALMTFEDIFDERINAKNFKPLFRKLYTPAIFQKEYSELKLKERILNWFIERKVYLMLEGTPIKTLYILFNYYINELANEIGFYQQCIEKLKKLKTPFLLMNGTADVITPPQMAQHLVKEIPHAKLKLFDGYQHVSPSLRKKEAMNIMKEYVAVLRSL